jgi:hypothetical protein
VTRLTASVIVALTFHAHSAPVVGNKADLLAEGAQCEVFSENVQNFVQRQSRSPMHFVEASMKDGYNLRWLHHYLNVPFLHLQVNRSYADEKAE